MSISLPRTLALATSVVVLSCSSYFIYQSFHLWRETETISRWVERGPAVHTPAANPKEASASEGGHEGAKSASSNSGSPAVMDLDEVLTDLAPGRDREVHTINVKLELELFDEESRTILEKSSGALKDVIISVMQKQTVVGLSNVSGKLYFKELLVSKLNGFLNQPIVRDVHFTSFLIK